MSASVSPLSGRRILITRSGGQSEALADRLRELGALPVVMPTIAILPVEVNEDLDAAIGRLDDYDGILFTSANAVTFFCDRADVLGRTAVLRRARLVAAVGPQTARALALRGLTVGATAAEHTAEGLFAALAARGVAGRRFLVPCADRAREELPRLLVSAGATVDKVIAYRTVAASVVPAVLDQLRGGEVDVVTFLSPSAAEGLARSAADAVEAAGRAVVAVIGPTTRAACEGLGFRVDIEARTNTMAGLVQAIEQHFARRS